MPALSIIVPMYNEEQNVVPLHRAILASQESFGSSYEILLIDDGSCDSTFSIARGLAAVDPRLRVVKLRRNFGQTAAMAAGIDCSKGQILVTMDGDLQNDPQDIRQFIDKINEGYDIVVGWRYHRQDKLITRKIPSRVANWLIGKVTGVPIKDNGCSLKAYRATIIKSVPLYSEMHRFIPAMTSLAGARLAEIKVRHHARKYGTSKYGLARIYKVLLDMLTVKTLIAFSARPLLWFAILALPAFAASMALLLLSVYDSATNAAPFSVPIAGTGVLFGALAISLVLGGVLAELLYRTGTINLGRLSLLTASISPQIDETKVAPASHE